MKILKFIVGAIFYIPAMIGALFIMLMVWSMEKDYKGSSELIEEMGEL